MSALEFKPFKCAGCGRFFGSRQSLGLHWAHERKKPGRGCIGLDTADNHRAQRIRDIVAQQWVVACVLLEVGMPFDPDFAKWSRGPDPADPERGAGWILDDDGEVVMFAALPSAAEIVGGEP